MNVQVVSDGFEMVLAPSLASIWFEGSEACRAVCSVRPGTFDALGHELSLAPRRYRESPSLQRRTNHLHGCVQSAPPSRPAGLEAVGSLRGCGYPIHGAVGALALTHVMLVFALGCMGHFSSITRAASSSPRPRSRRLRLPRSSRH